MAAAVATGQAPREGRLRGIAGQKHMHGGLLSLSGVPGSRLHEAQGGMHDAMGAPRFCSCSALVRLTF